MYKFSIITVTYNSEKTIERTINSVLNQTFTDFEYLIIDGLSSDSTMSIAEKYKEKIPNLIIVSEKDSGIYNAMNKGAGLASGEYLLFLNSDDFYNKDFLACMYEEIQRNPADCLYGDFFAHQEDSMFSILSADLDELFYRMSLNHQAALIRNSVFKNLNGYDENLKIAADWDFFLRALISGCSFHKYSEAFVHFYFGGLSSIKDCEPEKEYIIRKNISNSLNIRYADIKYLFCDGIFLNSPEKERILNCVSRSNNQQIITTFLYMYSLFLNRNIANMLNKITTRRSYRIADKVRNNPILMKVYRLFCK